MTFPVSLRSLQTELIAARRHYEDALKGTADREVAALILEMVELRARAERQIRKIVGSGEAEDEQRAFVSFLQRAVASVRASMVGTAAEALPAFVDGEAQIMLAYNNAIEECRPYQKIVDLLEAQRAELLRAVLKMDRAIVGGRDPVRREANERTMQPL